MTTQEVQRDTPHHLFSFRPRAAHHWHDPGTVHTGLEALQSKTNGSCGAPFKTLADQMSRQHV